METRGIILTNLSRYFSRCDRPLVEMSPVQRLGFDILRQKADAAFSDYEERSKRNRENALKRSQKKTSEEASGSQLQRVAASGSEDSQLQQKKEERSKKIEARRQNPSQKRAKHDWIKNGLYPENIYE